MKIESVKIKNFKSFVEKNKFKISSAILFIITVLIIFYALFDFPLNISSFKGINYFLTDISTNISNCLKFSSNLFYLDEQIRDISITISTILAGLLAIVFSVSLFNIQIISEKYTPSILEYYSKDERMKNLLFTCLATVLIAVSFLYTYNFLTDVTNLSLLILLLGCFMLSISRFVDYFFWILKIINPIKLSDELKKDCKKYVEQKNEKELHLKIASLGDVAIKAIRLREESTVEKYINTLNEILEYEYIKDEKNIILSLVLDQYYRIYKESILNKKDTYTIIEYLSDIPCWCRDKNHSLKTDPIYPLTDVLSSYYNFCKVAIKEKDESRFDLIKILISILKTYYDDKDRYWEGSTHKLMTDLFKITKLIIDYDDYELYEKEIDYISRFYKNPVDLRDEITDNVLYSIKDNEENKKYIEYLIKCYFDKTFGRWDKDGNNMFSKEFLETIKKLKKENIKKIEIPYIEDVLHDDIHQLVVVSKICKCFFAIGAYILYKEKDKIDSVKYIKELWHPANLNADDDLYNKEGIICFDVFWLTNLILYGGMREHICTPPFNWIKTYYFDKHCENDEYFMKYYFLVIASTDLKLDLPSISGLEKLKKDGKKEELSDLCEFANYFVYRMYWRDYDFRYDKLIDGLIKEKEWENLFRNKDEKRFEKVNKWIDDTKKDCEKLKKKIEKLLDL